MSKYLPVGTEVIVQCEGKDYESVIKQVDSETGYNLPYLIGFNGRCLWFSTSGRGLDEPDTKFKVKEEKKVANFKEGDMVKLKDKFYDEPDFKELDRYGRKSITSLVERELVVIHVYRRVGVFDGIGNNSWVVPASILELAELSKPKITGVWFDECTDYPPKKPAMRKWTEAEITEAKAITCDLFFSIVGKNFGYKFLDYYCRIHMNGKEFTAKACNTDEPNINIGRMVALCKATGRPFPDWIRKESK